MNAVFRPQAREDILRQFRWYLVEQNAAETADRFIDAVEVSVEQLLVMPHVGAPKAFTNPVLAGLRSWPVKGFDEIRIYYVVQGEILRVLRVLHGRRDVPQILESTPPDDAIQ